MGLRRVAALVVVCGAGFVAFGAFLFDVRVGFVVTGLMLIVAGRYTLEG